MKLSSEKQSHLSHKIVEHVGDKIKSPSQEVLFELVRQGVQNFAREWDELEKEILDRLKSLKRELKEGSSEWDILYRKALEEQFQKKSIHFIKK